MKILFVIESLRSGGKERRLVELIKGLKAYPEIEIELVLTRKEIHYTEILNVGIKIHFIDNKGLKTYPKLFLSFYKIIREFRPDIIHLWSGWLAIFSIPSAKILNSKIINNSITYALPVKSFSKLNIISLITFPFCDFIVSNSKAGLRVHGLENRKNSLVIYNGFDFSRFFFNKKTDLRKEYSLEQRAILVGMIASFTEAKDYKTFLKAAEILTNKYKSLYFMCIGDGPYLKKYVVWVKKKKLSNIKFLGLRDDVENICQQLDIGVLLTNTDGHAEGISNSIIEIMAAGKPIIATNAGGTTEIIKDHETGFLISPFDEQQLVHLIEFLIKNKRKRKQIGEEAKKMIYKNFSLDKMISEYLKLYEILITRNK